MGQRAKGFPRSEKRKKSSGFIPPLSIILNSSKDTKRRRQFPLWWYFQTVSPGQLQLDKLFPISLSQTLGPSGIKEQGVLGVTSGPKQCSPVFLDGCICILSIHLKLCKSFFCLPQVNCPKFLYCEGGEIRHLSCLNRAACLALITCGTALPFRGLVYVVCVS